jgi:hypothetical protein
MDEWLFAYGPMKTGGAGWALELAPAIGVPDRLTGFALYQTADGTPLLVRGGPEDVVYGERFLVDFKTIHQGEVLYTAKTETDIYVRTHGAFSLPHGAVRVPFGCWRDRSLTVGLSGLCQDWIHSGKDRTVVIQTIRDRIRPLAQMNWVSIPWRTGANTSEWQWCRDYAKRLAMAAEIGL